MNLDYFAAAERDIASLPMLEKSLPILEMRRKRLIDAGAPKRPKGIDFSKPYTDVGTANDTLRELVSIAEVTRELEATRAEILEIRGALAGLEKEQREVLLLVYTEGLSAREVAERIHVASEKTVYDIRNRGIANFALLYYGSVIKKGRKNGK